MNNEEKIMEAQGLRQYIIEELQKKDLSLDHQFKLHNVVKGEGGNFVPTDLKLAIMDVKIWLMDNEHEKLIQLAKQLPTATKGSTILFYINGKRCKKSAYFSGDSIKGVRTVRGIGSKAVLEDMDVEQFKKSAFSGTRLGDKMGLAKYGDDFREADFEKPETGKTAHYPEPKSQAPATQEEDVNDFGDDTGAEDYDEFRGHDEPWVNRPKEDDDEKTKR